MWSECRFHFTALVVFTGYGQVSADRCRTPEGDTRAHNKLSLYPQNKSVNLPSVPNDHFSAEETQR